MSQSHEIKCPHCGEWTTRVGRNDDVCANCGGYVEPHRFSSDAEKKTHKVKKPKASRFFSCKTRRRALYAGSERLYKRVRMDRILFGNGFLCLRCTGDSYHWFFGRLNENTA